MSSSSKPKSNVSSQLCSSLRPDDGLSPLELAKLQRQQHRQRDAHRGQHRSLQYTKAARQVLEMALAELCVAAPLDTLFLHDVEEAPSSAMLHVTLIATDSTDAQLAVIQPHLKALTTQLRAILAQSVRRRRTPHLRLHLIPGQLPAL